MDLKGAKKLYLVVSDGGDGFNWDHANLIEPKLTCKNGTLKLTDVKWVKASGGWGKPTIDKSVGGPVLNSAELPQDSLSIELNLKELGLSGKCKVRDLWGKKDIGVYSDKFSVDVPNHGTRLVRISRTK